MLKLKSPVAETKLITSLLTKYISPEVIFKVFKLSILIFCVCIFDGVESGVMPIAIFEPCDNSVISPPAPVVIISHPPVLAVSDIPPVVFDAFNCIALLALELLLIIIFPISAINFNIPVLDCDVKLLMLSHI